MHKGPSLILTIPIRPRMDSPSSQVTSPPPITDELSTWLMEAQWAGILALEDHQPFGGIAKDMEKKSEAWMNWGSHELCETLPLPGEWEKSLTDFQRLLLLRAVRPDRITAGLAVFVEKIMGPAYVNQEAFNALTMFEESGPSTPMFFVLFPGYSPSKDVEQLAISLGKTTENGQLTLISMGQGQEPVAEGVLDKYTQNGGWVFLDNVHLMQGWIPQLERKLEIAAETAHKDFRCFFSAEPIAGAPFAKIVPESILQTCIKISNEPPSDMKSNMRRALAPFSQVRENRPSSIHVIMSLSRSGRLVISRLVSAVVSRTRLVVSDSTHALASVLTGRIFASRRRRSSAPPPTTRRPSTSPCCSPFAFITRCFWAARSSVWGLASAREAGWATAAGTASTWATW